MIVIDTNLRLLDHTANCRRHKTCTGVRLRADRLWSQSRYGYNCKNQKEIRCITFFCNSSFKLIEVF